MEEKLRFKQHLHNMKIAGLNLKRKNVIVEIDKEDIKSVVRNIE